LLITEVSVRVSPFSGSTWLDRQRVSTPMSVFPRFAESRSSWRGPGSDLVSIMIRTDDPDVFGLGQSRGGRVTAALISEHLAGLIRGQDPAAIAMRCSEMNRAAAPYASGATASMAVSAVDQALWDLNARAASLPLYKMLGGTAGPLPSYLTCSDPQTVATLGNVQPTPVVVKIPAPYGPADGADALRRNAELIATAADALPVGAELALDCFMSWDVRFTYSLVRAVTPSIAPRRLAWIEEPLRPDDHDGYRRLRRMLPAVRLAAGEHVYGLRDGLRFIAADCVDIVQFDVSWCGGVRTALVLGEAALDRGAVFAPHAAGIQPWATHLLSTFGPGTLAEVLLGVHGVTESYPAAPGDDPGVGLAPQDLGFAT
jgi:L-rhamnonate dehydratase